MDSTIMAIKKIIDIVSQIDIPLLLNVRPIKKATKNLQEFFLKDSFIQNKIKKKVLY